MSYSVMGSKNNSCWPVPMGQFRTAIGPRGGGGGGRRSMGALMQATAGTGLFRNAPWRAMGDDVTSTFTISGNSSNAFTVDANSGDAVASTPSAKGIFIDLQNQLNRLCAYYTLNDLLLTPDGIIGPNTLAAASGVLGMLANSGYVSGMEGAAADITTLASQADSLASYLDQQASALGAPSVSVPAAKAGGGSGAAPAPASAVAKNNKVRTPILLFGAIDLTDPLTWAMIAAAGTVAYVVGKKNKRGSGGRRRAPRRRAKRAPRRRAATRRTRARRRGRR